MATTYHDRKNANRRAARQRQRRQQKSDLRYDANSALPTVPKKKKMVEVGEKEWRYSSGVALEVFQRQLSKAVKALTKKGATKFRISHHRVKLTATGPETDAQFVQRKADVAEKRAAILDARRQLKELTKQERQELATTRKLLLEATRNLSVDEFDQLVSDVLRHCGDDD